jgi:hypothetical protein
MPQRGSGDAAEVELVRVFGADPMMYALFGAAEAIVTGGCYRGYWLSLGGHFERRTRRAAARRHPCGRCGRLLRHSHVITIRGDSYRLREKRRTGLLEAPAIAPGVPAPA